jgi:uncharacterized protein
MNDFLPPLLVIVTTAVIQSVFGVGVLLLGTPWLLVLGMGFTEALWLLLPVSLAISTLQFVLGRDAVDRAIVKGIAAWALPSIFLALWITTLFRPPVELGVAVIVLGVAAMDSSTWIRARVDRMVKHRRSFLVFAGLVHGISSLGGSLLTALVYAALQRKETARATIAIGYALFATIQLFTLWVVGASGMGSLSRTSTTMVLGATIFIVVERLTTGRIDTKRYRAGLSVLLALTGGLILFRAAFQ